jgi:2,3-bisphosphoglycerate-dependent phosphoglycerate mutase
MVNKYCYIYIFRHGLTTYNKQKRFTGFVDAKLTKKGVKDAKKVARKLKNKKIDVAYQTHLSRSGNTLKEVLKFHPECKEIITDDRMIERCYGLLQKKTHKGYKQELKKDIEKLFIKKYGKNNLTNLNKLSKEISEKIYNIFHRSYDVPPPGGESVKMVEKRVNSFIRDLLKKVKKEKVNVAISAHGNSMRPFRKYFEKFDKKKMMSLENPWDDYFEYKIKIK